MRKSTSEFHHPMGTYRRKPFFDSLDGELDNGPIVYKLDVLWKNGFASEQVGCKRE